MELRPWFFVVHLHPDDQGLRSFGEPRGLSFTPGAVAKQVWKADRPNLLRDVCAPPPHSPVHTQTPACERLQA